MKMILGWANLAWLFTSLVFQIILIRFVCSYRKKSNLFEIVSEVGHMSLIDIDILDTAALFFPLLKISGNVLGEVTFYL